ncbi:MAG: hypothetical protein ABIH99_03005 [Candidatus Micrarchaeota archaeon]
MSSLVRTLIKDRRIQVILAVVAFSILLLLLRGAHFGIEFEGGTRIPIILEQPVSPDMMDEIVTAIKLRVSAYGMTQVVVRGVGNNEIHVEVPKSDSELVSRLSSILKEEGRFEGIVDGKLAVSDKGVIKGSITKDAAKIINNRVSWSVSFAISQESAQHFAKTVKGKANYPLYMFLDRPEDAVVLITKSELLGGNATLDEDAKAMVDDALTKDEKILPILVLDNNWEALRGHFAQTNTSLFTRTNQTKVILGEKTSESIKNELRALNYTLVEKTEEEMIPEYSISETKSYLQRWAAVGLQTAPVLTAGVTEGTPSVMYRIDGYASGATLRDQQVNAELETKRLKSILSGGALPVEVMLGSITTIPAPLGAEFLRYSGIGAIFALLAVGLIVGLRYASPRVILPIMFICALEMIILVCIIGSVGTIDLAAMAGIIAAVGSSVDDQIVITDEILKKKQSAGGEEESASATKSRLSKALFIVFSRCSVAIIAMVPLLFSGLVEIIGFALATIMGAFLGVLMAAPAYTAIAENLLMKKEQ